jgi:hypothetical protein
MSNEDYPQPPKGSSEEQDFKVPLGGFRGKKTKDNQGFIIC